MQLEVSDSSVRPRVALVIGSGGIKCVAGFGVVRVLRQHGIPIDMAVGCSGGAVCAAWVAGGGGDIGTEEAALQYMRDTQQGIGKTAYRQLLGAVFPRVFKFNPYMGILSDEATNYSLRRFFGSRRFEDLTMPLHMVATDFETGAKVVMSNGALFDAVRASLAIPLIFPPWPVNGRYLVDGAVCDPLPVDIAIKEGADIIIAVGFESPSVVNVTSGLNLIDRFTTMSCNHLLRSQYAFHNLAHHSEVISILPNFGEKVGLRDFHRGPSMLEAGAAAAEVEIPYLKRLLKVKDTSHAAAATSMADVVAAIA